MTKTLIVHGLDGSPDPHWQHWWAMTDSAAIVVNLPNPSRPSPAEWEVELASVILRHPDSILVGHSLGAVLIARVLSTWPQLRARGALLVAPAETQGNDRIGQFGAIPERPLGLPSAVVASRNDPWMGFDRAGQLARNWGADLVDLGQAGHINVASGFGPWPQGKDLRNGLLAAGSRPQRPTVTPRAGVSG